MRLSQLQNAHGDLECLGKIAKELRQRHLQIFHVRAEKKQETFKDRLLLLKSNMMQLRQKLRSLPGRYRERPIELIDEICIELDGLHANLNAMQIEVLKERVDLLKRMVASLQGFLPTTLLELDMNENEILRKIPIEVRSEVAADFEEIRRCYSNQAYRASIAFCGRILETILGRRYYEQKTRLSPQTTPKTIEQEVEGLTLGQIIDRCRQIGLLASSPDLDLYAGMINEVRILSIHHKGRKYIPGPEAVKGTINFASEIIRELYP